MNRTEMNAFAESWISDWNNHDLESILNHYDEDIVLYSPMIVPVTGQTKSSITGRAALRAYWKQALALAPDLQFELQDVLLGSDALTILYRNQVGRGASETFVFTDQNLVSLSIATYGTA
mgnify:CR=1 FL=1